MKRRSPLPNYLRTHRKRARLSQQDVAFLIGCKSSARISRYERCRQNPNLRTLLAYELLLHTPIRELYGGVAEEVERDMKKRVRLFVRHLARRRPDHRNERKAKFLVAIWKEVPRSRAP